MDDEDIFSQAHQSLSQKVNKTLSDLSQRGRSPTDISFLERLKTLEKRRPYGERLPRYLGQKHFRNANWSIFQDVHQNENKGFLDSNLHMCIESSKRLLVHAENVYYKSIHSLINDCIDSLPEADCANNRQLKDLQLRLMKFADAFQAMELDEKEHKEQIQQCHTIVEEFNSELNELKLEWEKPNQNSEFEQCFGTLQRFLKQQSENSLIGRLIVNEVKDSSNQSRKYYIDSLRFEDESVKFKVKELDFTKFKEVHQNYLLYSGQILFLEAEKINNNSKELQVLRKLDLKYQGSREIQNEPQNKIYQRDYCVSIVVLAGPFTQKDSDAFVPLVMALQKIKSSEIPCDAVVLMGPMIDIENQKFQEYDERYEDLHKKLLKAVEDELPNSLILYINSVDEVLSHNVLPQPPFNLDTIGFYEKRKDQQRPEQVRAFGNPVRMLLEQTFSIGIFNDDLMADLPEVEYKGVDKEISFLTEVLEQGTFVPCYPSALHVDRSLAKKYLCWGKPTPDIILFKSKKGSQFVKRIQETLFIRTEGICQSGQLMHLSLFHNNSDSCHLNTRIDYVTF